MKDQNKFNIHLNNDQNLQKQKKFNVLKCNQNYFKQNNYKIKRKNDLNKFLDNKKMKCKYNFQKWTKMDQIKLCFLMRDNFNEWKKSSIYFLNKDLQDINFFIDFQILNLKTCFSDLKIKDFILNNQSKYLYKTY